MAMAPEFKELARDLLRFKRSLFVAFLGALLNAVCFGVGLGMLKGAISLLTRFKDHYTLASLVRPWIDTALEKGHLSADLAQSLQAMANSLPTDPFIAFCSVLGVILILTAVGNTGRFFHEWITISIIMRTAMHWRAKLMRKMIHAPYEQLLRTGRSDNLVKILNDTHVLAGSLRIILGRAAGELLKAIAGLFAAFFINWRLTLLAMVGAPVIGVLLRKFGKTIRRATKRALQQRGKLTAAILEALGGIQVVKAFGAEGYERRRFAHLNRTLYREEMRMRTVRAFSSPAIEVLSMVGIVVVGSVAAWMIFRQDQPADDFITVLTCLAASATAVKPLANFNNQWHESSAAAERIGQMLKIPQEPSGYEASRQTPKLKSHAVDIRFEQVCYTYPNQDQPAIRDLTLHVQHGMEVAIVGGNGSGKSTLLSLLTRLLEPQSGRVLIDHTDISQVNLRSLRRQIAIVTQQAVLFEGTVAENIAYNHRHLNQSKIIQAAKLAHADHFIQELPGGYQYRLSEDGHGLSGGQCQRLCIARAILRDPTILILDEATSQIDAESEAKINQALHDIRRGRTVFVIAHRLSTVIDADLIVVMENGKILDQGTHSQLLQRCDAYQSLVQNQLNPTVTTNDAMKSS